MLSETHIFSPNFLNEVRLGFDRVSLQVNQQNQHNNLNQAVGLPTVSMNPRDTGLSEIVVSGFSTLGDEINNPQRSTSNIYELTDNANWTRGSHVFKFGADLRSLQQNAFADVESRGLLEFVGFTGNALADGLHDARDGALFVESGHDHEQRIGTGGPYQCAAAVTECSGNLRF